MKLNRYISLIAVGLAFAACSNMDDIVPEGGTMLASQVQKTNEMVPSRAEASFNGMFVNIGLPDKSFSTPDDWQFLMINFCNDLEGADVIMPDSGYNWFSVCGEYSSRNANYRNPLIRYGTPYNMISSVNTFLASYGEDVTDESSLNMIAQAKVLRAWSYLLLVSDFQFNYQVAKDKPSVPLVTEETVDFTNNPRASVADIYGQILKDLDAACEILDASTIARATKMYIDKHVAHGMRARAYLDMGEWKKAYDDAVAAADGFTPRSIEECGKPSFKDISEADWIWGYDITTDVAAIEPYATTSSWLRSFSANGYSPSCQCYCMINSLLYNKIADSDVRKGWWVDEDLKSPLLDGLTWDGQPVANYQKADVKEPFLPYTNVKFGCNTIGTTTNDEDMPLMRVEEMILIQAECQAHIDAGTGKKIIEDFVKTYRDPSYSSAERGLSLLDEIWFQRRVELWGEGFGIKDIKRLNKPLVRFHDASNNQPDAFRFNMKADDGWLLMRFPQSEMDTNFGIEDNKDGEMPVMDQNKELRDGVTD